jgi:hypothetical protein
MVMEIIDKFMEIIGKLLETEIIFPLSFYIGGMLFFVFGLYLLLFNCQFFQDLNKEITIEMLNSTTQYTCNSIWSLFGITNLMIAFLIFSLPLLQLIVLMLFIILEKRKSKLSKSQRSNNISGVV